MVNLPGNHRPGEAFLFLAAPQEPFEMVIVALLAAGRTEMSAHRFCYPRRPWRASQRRLRTASSLV